MATAQPGASNEAFNTLRTRSSDSFGSGGGTTTSSTINTQTILVTGTGGGETFLGSLKENEEDLRTLPEYKLNGQYFRRLWMILWEGLGYPWVNPFLWSIILLNYCAQIAGGYIAQMIFYFTATGTGDLDPGMAGCLGKGCGNLFKITNSALKATPVYAPVNGTWQWTSVMFPTNPAMARNLIAPPGDADTILPYMVKFSWSFALLVICVWLFSVTGDVINVFIRRRVGRILHRTLLKGNTLYRLTLDGRVDNFDQRITSDLQAALDGICCVIFGNAADYSAYPVGFCSSRMSFSWYNALQGAGGIPPGGNPGYIVAVVFALASITLIAYILPMNAVSRVFFIGQMYEGDFRYTHTRTVVHSESIALYRGESREKAHAERRFMKILINWRKYYIFQGTLMIFRLISINCQPSVSYIALSMTNAKNASYANFFNKQFGDVVEYLLYYPVMISRLAFVAGVTHRVGQLMEVVDELQKAKEIQAVTSKDAEFIELTNIVARPPVFKDTKRRKEPWYSICWSSGRTDENEGPNLGEPLFRNLCLRVERGHSVVIMGPSGCGKSSLLRVIGGLWPITEGTVQRPEKVGRDGFFFLPQRPYVFPDSLAAQVTYPNPATRKDKRVIKPILAQVGLSHLLEKLDTNEVFDWGRVLSTSEQQRLGFARMFFHQPRFCLSDEATSSMDLHMENKCMKQCAVLGITLISVAHRPSVIPHHEFVFRCLEDARTWELVSAKSVETSTGLTDDVEPVEAPAEEEDDTAKVAELDGLGKVAVRRVYTACKMAVSGVFSWATLAFLLMFVNMSMYGGLQIIIFKWYGTSDIINNVIGGNTSTAMSLALNQLGVNIAGSFCMAFAAISGALYGLMVQRAIIKEFHRNYFHRRVPFLINKVDKSIPDIDQRVVQDLSAMREALAWLFGNPFAYQLHRNGVLVQIPAFIIMISYSFSLSWSLTLFFVLVMIWILICQIVACMVTSKAAELRAQKEADLRMHYGRLRNFCESITFFGGQARELELAEKLLDITISSRFNYALKAAFTTFPTVTTYYWLQNGDYMMASIIQLYCQPWAGAPKQIYTMLSYMIVVGKLVMPMVMATGGFGMLAGNTHRVMSALEKAWEMKRVADEMPVPVRGSKIEMSGVTVTSPGGKRNLVNNLTFTVEKDQSMVIMGPSGCGKTSIFRVLGELVPASGGAFCVPRQETVFFVGQTSYSTEGTLTDQIIYPLDHTRVADDVILSILDEVGLLYLSKRWGLHTVVNWDDVLSGGEMQRLGVARMLFANPLFAILDESTSALDVPLEARMLQACTRRGITLLSIATRPSVMKYHGRLLKLDGNGGYNIQPLVDGKPPEAPTPSKGPAPGSSSNVLFTRPPSARGGGQSSTGTF